MALGELKRTAASLGFFMVICFIGSLGIMYIEYVSLKIESHPSRKAPRAKVPEALVKNMRNYLVNQTALNWSSTQVRNLLRDISNKQETPTKKNVTWKTWQTDLSWSTYTQWQYFSVITLSTIGYGDITPESNAGKLFVILFAMIGIPVHMYMAASMGVLLSRGLTSLRNKVEMNILGKKQPRGTDMTCFFLCLVTAVLYVVAVGLSVASIENWTKINGIYWAFVTFSTIGYGDLLTESKGVPIWFGTVGLVIVAMTYDTLMKAIENREQRKSARCGMEQKSTHKTEYSQTTV